MTLQAAENDPSQGHALTDEQLPIVHYKGKKLVVKAYAGTGKTSTLVQYAIANPNSRILYLAFNRAIRDEAVTKFPKHVDCKTSHQLAYAVFGRQLAHKLSKSLRLRDVAEAIGTASWGVAADVLATLNTFLASADTAIDGDHFTSSQGREATEKALKRKVYCERVVDSADMLWQKMCDPEDECPASHDTYLKLYQLSKPDLALRYEIVLFDEGQDANPVTTAFVTRQSCTLVVVGDKHQSIYAFRGADNALDSPILRDADQLFLTHSFRFGASVAAIANALLSLKGETRPVYGLGGDDEVIPAGDFSLKTQDGPVTFLSRTVMGVIQMALFFSKRGLPVHLVGGHEAYALSPIENLYWLSRGLTDRIKDKRMLAEFDSFADYESMAEECKDPEMIRALKIIAAYPNLPDDLATLRQHTTSAANQALITLATAHRSKGLEWPTVYLCDDFPDIFDPELDDEAREQEINLLYVASTRAEKRLVVNDVATNAVKWAYTQQQRQRTPSQPK